jgi:hypothetical protein
VRIAPGCVGHPPDHQPVRQRANVAWLGFPRCRIELPSDRLDRRAPALQAVLMYAGHSCQVPRRVMPGCPSSPELGCLGRQKPRRAATRFRGPPVGAQTRRAAADVRCGAIIGRLPGAALRDRRHCWDPRFGGPPGRWLDRRRSRRRLKLSANREIWRRARKKRRYDSYLHTSGNPRPCYTRRLVARPRQPGRASCQRSPRARANRAHSWRHRAQVSRLAELMFSYIRGSVYRALLRRTSVPA